MTAEQLRNLHHATPFVPFDVHLADGRSLLVAHPEFLSMSPSGRTAAVHGKGDSLAIIGVLMITSLEPRNGSTRHRKGHH